MLELYSEVDAEMLEMSVEVVGLAESEVPEGWGLEAEGPSRQGGTVVPRTNVRRWRPGSSLQERSPPGHPQPAKHPGAEEQGEVSSR